MMEKEERIPSARPSLVSVVAMGIGLLTILFTTLRTISAGAFWSHLVTGRWIMEHGIPRTDGLSLLGDGAPWVASNWLYDVLLYALFGAGAGTVIVVHALMATAAFALLIPVGRRWADGASVGLALLLCAWLMIPVVHPGPHVVALVFPALLIAVLDRARAPALLWPVVLVNQLLWTNMHGSFVLGPVILLAYSFAAMRELPTDTTETTVPLRLLLLLAGASLVVTLVNPYGPQLHAHLAESIGHPANPYLLTWISPFSGHFSSMLAKHLITASLFVGAGGLLTFQIQRKLPIAITTLAMAGAGLALFMVLHVQVFAILAMPFLCLSIASLAIVGQRNLHVPASVGGSLVIVAGLVSCGVIVSNQYYRSVGATSAFGLGVNREIVPAEAAVLLDRPDFPERCVNLALDGGYLAWTHPERKIFVDQRLGLYKMDAIEQFVNALRGQPEALQAFLTTWEPEAFVLNAGLANTYSVGLTRLLLSGAWRLCYFDGSTLVLVRNLPKFAALYDNPEAQRHGLQVLEATRDAFIGDMQGLRGAPLSPRIMGAGLVFYFLQRFPEAEAALEMTLLNSPNYQSGWLPLGVSQKQNGRIDQAILTLTRATQLMPDNPLAWIQLGEACQAVGDTDSAHRAIDRARELNPGLVAPPTDAASPPAGV